MNRTLFPLFRRPLARLAGLLMALLLLPSLQAQYYNLSTDLLGRDVVRNLQVLDPSTVTPVSAWHVTTGWSEDPATVSGVTFANLVTYDAAGSVLWSRLYDFGSGFSRGNAVEQTLSGGYVVAGQAINPATAVPSAFVLETDPLGNVMWASFYDFFTPYSEAFSIEVVDPAVFGYEYLVTGTYRNAVNGTMDLFVLGIVPGGAAPMVARYDTGLHEEGQSIKTGPSTTGTVTPSIFVSGYTTFGSAPGRNILVMELTPGGAMIWANAYGGPADEEGRSLEVLGADLIVAGYSNSFSNGNDDVIVLRLGPGGFPIWSNIYGQKKNEQAYSVECISDGTIAVTGYTDRTPTGTLDAFLFKTDPGGTLLWSKSYGGPRDEIGYSVKEHRLGAAAGLIGELIMGGTFAATSAAVLDDRDLYNVYTDINGDGACPRKPQFRQLPVPLAIDPMLLPQGVAVASLPAFVADPAVPFTQNDECCDCSDMTVSFSYSPAVFCAGTPVTFANTSDCVDQFRWSVNGTVIGFSTNMTYVFPGPGTYTVTLDGRNVGCPSVSTSQTIVVSCSPPSPRMDQPLEEELMLAPNPASDAVRVSAELAGAERAELVLTDATGRIVLRREAGLSAGTLTETLDLTGLPAGLYTVEVRTAEGRWRERLVVND
jgi:hypothetical protein